MRENAINLWTKAAAIRNTINFHKVWLEEQLHAPISETVIYEVDIDLTQIGNEYLLGSCGLEEEIPRRTLRRMRTFVATAEFPRRFPPILEVATKNVRDDLGDIFGDAKPALQPGLYWGDVPLALRLRTGGVVLIAVNVPYFGGPSASYESTAHIIVARRDRASEALRFIAQIARRDQQPRICVQDGPTRPVASCQWEDLILDQTVLTLLRDDFESHFQRRDWYRQNRLPFRRGYLFHGEPGNGKTSAVRAMLTSRGLTAYTLRFFDPRVDDGDLNRMVDTAARNYPSVLLFEDIDRVFPKDGSSKTNLSLQALLSCLDGVATADGLIVVGTANMASQLDESILRRPGRFDRVVHFAKPTSKLRMQYLLKFNQGIDAHALELPVAESDGFSFAMLRESVVLGGQRAFDEKRDIVAEDLLYGIRTLRQTIAQGARNSKSAGFISGRHEGEPL